MKTSKTKISIVMPCYNCDGTLLEAVNSCFTQNLKPGEFEIVMVDDGSTDGTRDLIQRLSEEHEQISYFLHDKNLGGGQARNTGISNSKGECIFCLDSDNYFPPNTLRLMLDHLEKENVDAVLIHERRFFKDTNPAIYESHFNKIQEKPFELGDLLSGGGLLLDNFLFTRDAYNRTLGYPTKHGFDTQCFEFRFLSAGNKVVTAPQAVFYHRQITKHGKSYFQRVYEQGMFSINCYLIFEELLPLLNDDLISDIIDYDIFSSNKLGDDNIKSHLEKAYQESPADFFRKGYEAYLGKEGLAAYVGKMSGSLQDNFIKAVFLYHKGDFEEAQLLLLDLKKIKPDSKVIAYNLNRCELALSERPGDEPIEERAAYLNGLKPKKRVLYWGTNIAVRLLSSLKRTFIEYVHV